MFILILLNICCLSPHRWFPVKRVEWFTKVWPSKVQRRLISHWLQEQLRAFPCTFQDQVLRIWLEYTFVQIFVCWLSLSCFHSALRSNKTLTKKNIQLSQHKFEQERNAGMNKWVNGIASSFLRISFHKRSSQSQTKHSCHC